MLAGLHRWPARKGPLILFTTLKLSATGPLLQVMSGSELSIKKIQRENTALLVSQGFEFHSYCSLRNAVVT